MGLVLLAAISGCSAPLTPVAGDVFDAACARLRVLGCSAGEDPSCAVAARRSEEQLELPWPAEQIAAAKTLAVVRAMRIVECL